jgi:hypothetical protein
MKKNKNTNKSLLDSQQAINEESFLIAISLADSALSLAIEAAEQIIPKTKSRS